MEGSQGSSEVSSARSRRAARMSFARSKRPSKVSRARSPRTITVSLAGSPRTAKMSLAESPETPKLSSAGSKRPSKVSRVRSPRTITVSLAESPETPKLSCAGSKRPSRVLSAVSRKPPRASLAGLPRKSCGHARKVKQVLKRSKARAGYQTPVFMQVNLKLLTREMPLLRSEGKKDGRKIQYERTPEIRNSPLKQQSNLVPAPFIQSAGTAEVMDKMSQNCVHIGVPMELEMHLPQFTSGGDHEHDENHDHDHEKDHDHLLPQKKRAPFKCMYQPKFKNQKHFLPEPKPFTIRKQPKRSCFADPPPPSKQACIEHYDRVMRRLNEKLEKQKKASDAMSNTVVEEFRKRQINIIKQLKMYAEMLGKQAATEDCTSQLSESCAKKLGLPFDPCRNEQQTSTPPRSGSKPTVVTPQMTCADTICPCMNPCTEPYYPNYCEAKLLETTTEEECKEEKQDICGPAFCKIARECRHQLPNEWSTLQKKGSELEDSRERPQALTAAEFKYLMATLGFEDDRLPVDRCEPNPEGLFSTTLPLGPGLGYSSVCLTEDDLCFDWSQPDPCYPKDLSEVATTEAATYGAIGRCDQFCCALKRRCYYGNPEAKCFGMKGIEWRGYQWHEECFRCAHCRRAIGRRCFIPLRAEVYHQECFTEKTGRMSLAELNWHLNPPAEARDCLVHGEPCRKPCESDEKKESCDVAEGDKEDPIKDCFGTRSGGHDISFNLAQVPDGTAEPGRNMLKQLTFAPAQFAGTSLEEYGSVSVPLKSSIQSKVEVPTKRRSALAASQGDQKVIRHVLPPTDPVSGDAFTRSGYPASGTHPRQATTNWDACVHPEIVSQGPLTERAFDPTDPLPRPLTKRSLDPTEPLPSRGSIQGRLSIKSGAVPAIALSRRCVSGPTFYRKSNSDGRSMAQTPNRRRAATSGSHEGGIAGRGVHQRTSRSGSLSQRNSARGSLEQISGSVVPPRNIAVDPISTGAFPNQSIRRVSLDEFNTLEHVTNRSSTATGPLVYPTSIAQPLPHHQSIGAQSLSEGVSAYRRNTTGSVLDTKSKPGVASNWRSTNPSASVYRGICSALFDEKQTSGSHRRSTTTGLESAPPRTSGFVPDRHSTDPRLGRQNSHKFS